MEGVGREGNSRSRRSSRARGQEKPTARKKRPVCLEPFFWRNNRWRTRTPEKPRSAPARAALWAGTGPSTDTACFCAARPGTRVCSTAGYLQHLHRRPIPVPSGSESELQVPAAGARSPLKRRPGPLMHQRPQHAAALKEQQRCVRAVGRSQHKRAQVPLHDMTGSLPRIRG